MTSYTSRRVRHTPTHYAPWAAAQTGCGRESDGTRGAPLQTTGYKHRVTCRACLKSRYYAETAGEEVREMPRPRRRPTYGQALNRLANVSSEAGMSALLDDLGL
jgi:hypothetical protein